ncbi:MAG: hypothetical protein N3G20_03975 [Verrucomicrobiae bacterium]|nr:hypothetical protein [Verrucomicrobiae bacterium]
MKQQNEKATIWWVAPGYQAEEWDFCRRKGSIAIGGPDGDIRKLTDKQLKRELTNRGWPGGTWVVNAFVREMRPGTSYWLRKGCLSLLEWV